MAMTSTMAVAERYLPPRVQRAYTHTAAIGDIKTDRHCRDNRGDTNGYWCCLYDGPLGPWTAWRRQSTEPNCGRHAGVPEAIRHDRDDSAEIRRRGGASARWTDNGPEAPWRLYRSVWVAKARVRGLHDHP